MKIKTERRLVAPNAGGFLVPEAYARDIFRWAASPHREVCTAIADLRRELGYRHEFRRQWIPDPNHPLTV